MAVQMILMMMMKIFIQKYTQKMLTHSVQSSSIGMTNDRVKNKYFNDDNIVQ